MMIFFKGEKESSQVKNENMKIWKTFFFNMDFNYEIDEFFCFLFVVCLELINLRWKSLMMMMIPQRWCKGLKRFFSEKDFLNFAGKLRDFKEETCLIQ